MSRATAPQHKPWYRRAWPVVPVLALAGAWTVATFLPTDSPEALVPVHRSWTLMGTILEATVYRPAAATRLAQADLEAVHSAVLEIDPLMSLYRPDSELTALNTQAGMGPIEVSEPMFQVLEASQHYTHLSGGALDVTVQPLVELWGFDQMERTSIPPPAEIQAVLRRIAAVINNTTLQIPDTQAPIGVHLRYGCTGLAGGHSATALIARARASLAM